VIGVVVPAHNEQALLGRCLQSLQTAASHPDLCEEPVCIVVVLDACTDASAQIARQYQVINLSIEAHNVGLARRAGAAHAITLGARWLACTDADSCVAPDWLVQQLQHDADVVCGTVHLDDWEDYDAAVQSAYHDRYQAGDGHRHIHGANLGICVEAYKRAGGFPPLQAHEDVRLIKTLNEIGARIVWSGTNSVATSARCDPRAHGGFGDYLQRLAKSLEADRSAEL
jgi:glycosyltransferase involved in cell wall biosynthesis